MNDSIPTDLPTCAACQQSFTWQEAYRAQDTPGSTPYNPPGHGVFRPRAYCPHCGALVAEWHIDRNQDYDEWAWYGDNAALNAARSLPPGPLLMWGKGIPIALLPTISEDRLALEQVQQSESVKKPKQVPSTPEAIQLARQASELLNQGEIDRAAQLFEQATAAGFNQRDQAFAASAVGMYYLWKHGDVEQAFRYCQRGEEIQPGANWQGNYVLSLIYTAGGDSQQAARQMADAQRYAGTVWWDGSVDRQLQAQLNAWLARHGQARLRALIAEESPPTREAEPGPASTLATPPARETKICPNCGQEIKLAAKLCRYCRARFALSESGYCTQCHQIVQAAPDGACPVCHSELLDRHIESQLITPQPALSAPPVSQPAQQTPAMQIAPPNLAQEKPPQGVLNFWQLYLLPNGRIDRKTFTFEGILPLGILFFLVTWISLSREPASLEMFGITITLSMVLRWILTWVLVMLIVKRLHDLGESGWPTLIWLLLLMVTPVAVLLGQDTSSGVWAIPSFLGLLLLLIHVARGMFAAGKSLSTRYGPPPGVHPFDTDYPLAKKALQRRRISLGIVLVAACLPLAIYSGARYLIDQNNLEISQQAYQGADCATGIERTEKVLSAWRLADFGDLAQNAKTINEACLPYQAAADQQSGGDYPAALAGFAALALDEPGSILGKAAQGRVITLFTSRQPAELAGVPACDWLTELDANSLVPQPETRLPELFMACAEAYQVASTDDQAVKMYQRLLADFAEHPRSGEAETALLDLPAACEQAVFLANQPAIVSRGDFLPRYYFHCAQYYDLQDSEKKAIDMYKRLLIDYPSHALADQAESGLLENPAACDSAEALHKEAALARRGELMPSLLYRCGQDFEGSRKFDQAVRMFELFMQSYPQHNLADEVNTALARSLVNAAKAAGAATISAPQRSGSTSSGETEVVIQNDSPERLRIVFSGPKALITEIEACSSCSTWTFPPLFCPEKGPIGRFTLPSGNYAVLVESIGESGVTPYTGDWDLEGGDKYYSCFYILRRMRFTTP